MFRFDYVAAHPTELADWIKEDPDFKAQLEAMGRWHSHSLREVCWYIDFEPPENEEDSLRISYQDIPAKVAAEAYLPRQPDEVRKHSRDLENEFFLPAEYRDRGIAILEANISQTIDEVDNIKDTATQ